MHCRYRPSGNKARMWRRWLWSRHGLFLWPNYEQITVRTLFLHWMMFYALHLILMCYKNIFQDSLMFSFLLFKNWLCPGHESFLVYGIVESYIFYVCIMSYYVFEMYSTVSRIRASCKKWPWFSHFAINACLAPLYSVEGMHIITVEGLGDSRRGLHPVQVIQLLWYLLISSKNGL